MAKKTQQRKSAARTDRPSRIGEYEAMIVLKPLLPDDVRQAVNDHIKQVLEDLDGKIVKTDVWGKRYLAYPIATHKEGYYILYDIDMPTSGVSEFERQLSLKQEVLRFLVVKRDKFSTTANTMLADKKDEAGEDTTDEA